MMRRWVLAVAASLSVPLVSPSSFGQVLLEKAGKFGPPPSSSEERLTFETRADTKSAALATTVSLSQGRARVLVADPDGKLIADVATTKWMRISGQSLRTSGKPGVYQVRVVAEQAVGDWRVKITSDLGNAEIGLFLIPTVGMITVALAACAAWWLYSGAQWRWFWIGAAVWTVGVVLKFVVAMPLNGPVLHTLARSLPRAGYLCVGSVYIGLLTGVFEVGVTLAAALVWKGMTRDAGRGVAVGVGAGGFEAGLLGLAGAVAVVVAILGPVSWRQTLFDSARTTQALPLFWLIGPVERIIAILCHTSSRALVLWGVARGRWWGPFAVGFLLLTAIDTVAGYVHLSGFVNTMSMWWVELALAPAALVSMPIVVWCVRHWPVAPLAASTAATTAPSAETVA